jgi:hypothetical protein
VYFLQNRWNKVNICIHLCIHICWEGEPDALNKLRLPHCPSTNREGFQRGRKWSSMFHTTFRSRWGRSDVRKYPWCPLNITLDQLQSRFRRLGDNPKPGSWGLRTTVVQSIADDSNKSAVPAWCLPKQHVQLKAFLSYFVFFFFKHLDLVFC